MVAVNVGHQHHIQCAELFEWCRPANRIDKHGFAIPMEYHRAMLDRVYDEVALGGFNFICCLAGERAEKAQAKCPLKNSIRCHWKGSSYRLARHAATVIPYSSRLAKRLRCQRKIASATPTGSKNRLSCCPGLIQPSQSCSGW